MKHAIKIGKARKKSSIGSMPLTWRDHLKAVPQSVIARLTSNELAELLDALRKFGLASKDLADIESLATGNIWDARQGRLREIGK